jgi:hypothetical protein
MMRRLQEFVSLARPTFQIALIAIGAVYLVLIPLGRIPKDYRWDTEEIILFGLIVVACSRLIDSVTDLSIGRQGVAAKFRQLENRQQEQQDQLLHQRAQIRSLQVALQGIVSQYEFDKLVGLVGEEPFLCRYSDDLFAELKHLRAMGLVIQHAGTGLTDMKNHHKDRPQEFDLKRFFYVTKLGREYMDLREELAREGSVQPT